MDWSLVTNIALAILTPSVIGLIGFVHKLNERQHALELKVATDYSALPAKIDKLTTDLEEFRKEFNKEFMPLLNQIKGSFNATKPAT